MPFAPASRKHTFALIGLTGHSGTGKTYGALLLAKGLSNNGKVALIDTENGRGSMFSDEFKYDVQELYPPFTPVRYTEQVQEAEKNGYGVLIIDSFSHEWESLGGVLEMADANGKKGLQKWMQPKIQHKRMVSAILQSRMHVIICMRGKDKMVQKKDESGKEIIVNEGVIPIQERRVIYEMTVSLVLGDGCLANHQKTPPAALAGLFNNRRIVEGDGVAIREWLAGGTPVDHALEQLKAQARAEASYGTEMFREYWRRMSAPQQRSLKPITDELKVIAAAADAAMQDKAEPSTPDREPGEDG